MEHNFTEQNAVKPSIFSFSSVLTLIFAALAFAMIFFSPFGPIDSSFIPFHPIGWAGIFVYLAMVICYSQKYQKSKDDFWFILALIFFPLTISNLYFFPIPEFMGLGMFGWGVVMLAVCFICFVIFSKVKILKYSNLLMLMLFPLFVAVWKLPQLGVPSAFSFLALLFIIVITVTLSYYSFLGKEYLLIAGIFVNFIVTGLIVTLYLINGFLPFGWSQPLMAVITDRIAIFGGILMVFGPTIHLIHIQSAKQMFIKKIQILANQTKFKKQKILNCKHTN
jgi:hypothetical protein